MREVERCLTNRAGEFEILNFDNWDWYLTIELKGGVDPHRTRRITESEALEWFKQRFKGRGYPDELFYYNCFSGGCFITIQDSPDVLRFEHREWQLMGASSEEILIGTNYGMHRTFLFSAKGRYFEIWFEQEHNSYLEPEPRGRFLNEEQAAMWFRGANRKIPELLLRYVKHLLLTPDFQNGHTVRELPVSTVGQEELNYHDTATVSNEKKFGDSTCNVSHEAERTESDKRDSLETRTLKQQRDDWLLDMRGTGNNPLHSLSELVSLLAIEAPRREWDIIESTTGVAAALHRAYERRTGKTWPFDGRGKRQVD